MSTDIRLRDLNGITSKRYGFEVRDWDMRGSTKEIVVGKCEFKLNPTPQDIQEASRDTTRQWTLYPQSLQGCSAEEIAALFDRINLSFGFFKLQATNCGLPLQISK